MLKKTLGAAALGLMLAATPAVAVDVTMLYIGDTKAFNEILEGAAKNLPAGYSHSYLADSRQYVQEGNQLAIAFGFALIIIFLVLAAQFESLRLPLAVILIVPMCLIAAIVGVFIWRQDNNILTQVGFIVHLISFLDSGIGREKAALAVAVLAIPWARRYLIPVLLAGAILANHAAASAVVLNVQPRYIAVANPYKGVLLLVLVYVVGRTAARVIDAWLARRATH